MMYTTYIDKHGPNAHGTPGICPVCPCVKTAPIMSLACDPKWGFIKRVAGERSDFNPIGPEYN